ncbi:MAG TPA: glycosyltransferase family 2 protein [bacterium]|nr:glycosyltransferase family 2 protein [bacterium]
MSAGTPFFSVITPCYNGGAAFERCLKAMQAQTFDDYELIVVDDGSTDGSDRLAERSGARVLRTTGRTGPSAARNAGAQEARGEYLFFIDADCETLPSTLARAAAVFREDPELDALFGSYDDAPVGTSLVSQYKNLQHHYVHQTGSPEAATFWSGCGAMRRTRFLELGGFDVERFPRPSIEDIELGYRVRKAGGRIRLEKTVQVKHHKVWTLGGLIKVDVFDRGIPWTLLMLERPEIIVPDLNLRWQGKASVALGMLLAVTLVAAPLLPAALWISAACAVALLMLNLDFYGFLLRKRGLFFAAASVPLHWLYFFYSGVAFALGHWRFRMRKAAGMVDPA